jgi:hypothetical protein
LDLIPSLPKAVTELVRLSAYMILQYPSLSILLAIIGIKRGFDQITIGISFLLVFTANIIAAVNFTASDKYVFYGFSYYVVAFWIGIGAKPFMAYLHNKTSLSPRVLAELVLLTTLIPPLLVYVSLPAILPRFGVTSQVLGIREIPFRPALSYFLIPSKRHYWGARQFAENTFQRLPAHAAIIADYVMAQPLLYLQQVEQQRPDVDIVEIYGDEQVSFALSRSERTPVFLAHIEPYYNIHGLEEHFTIVPDGPIYRLNKK